MIRPAIEADRFVDVDARDFSYRRGVDTSRETNRHGAAQEPRRQVRLPDGGVATVVAVHGFTGTPACLRLHGRGRSRPHHSAGRAR